jgi:hypothetical protein
MIIKPTTKYLTTKTVFSVTLIVVTLTILGIWLFGLGQHRSLYDNSLLSTTVLSVGFFLFLTVGLYKGVKLKDNVGKLTDQLKPSKAADFIDVQSGGDFVDAGDGIEGVIMSIFLWIVVTLLIGLFLWLFGAMLWTGIVVFVAMLYWVYFRAVRLVFKNSNKSKGNLVTSIVYGLFYTLLYNCWIYGIIFGTHYWI